jgi:hypothetical protein
VTRRWRDRPTVDTAQRRLQLLRVDQAETVSTPTCPIRRCLRVRQERSRGIGLEPFEIGLQERVGWVAAVDRRSADRSGRRGDRRSVGDERRPGLVPVDPGTASIPAALDQAALTSIVLGVAARGAGTLTSSMPFAYFASTWEASTPSGSAKFRWNAPYATSRTK